MKLRRLFCILTVLCLAIGILSVGASANTVPADKPTGGVRMVGLSDLTVTYSGSGEIPGESAPVYAAASGYVEGIDAAAQAVRDGMKARKSNIAIKCKIEKSEFEDTGFSIPALYQKVFEHTGDPEEGDYLRWQYSGMSINYGTYFFDKDYYYFNASANVKYYSDAKQEKAVSAKIAELCESLQLNKKISDYQKFMNIYGYMCDTDMFYDNANLNDDSYDLKYTAYAALINRTAVCQGFANLFYRLALEAGLDARIVTGSSFGGAHAWNIVEIDGKWYCVDTTWDMGRANWGYYNCLRSEADFADHYEMKDSMSGLIVTDAYPMAKKSYAHPKDSSSSEGDFKYDVKYSRAVITKYTGDEKEPVIPNTVGGYPVYAIGTKAFSGNKTVKTMAIPEGVQTIQSDALYGMKSLKTVVFPKSLITIQPQSDDPKVSASEMWFKGDAPKLSGSRFPWPVETVYYPSGNKTWTKDIMKDHKNADTEWKAYGSDKHLWKAAACDDPKTCYLCGKEKGEPIGHDFSEGVCTRCGSKAAKITAEPKTTYTALGEKAKFTVKAEGEGLKYQWYYKDPDGSKYKKCSGTKAAYSLEMTEARRDRKLYCIITDKYGNEVKSKTVTMKMAASIKTQPKTQYVQLDEKAKFTVKAVGDDLKYQWYYKSAGSSKYKKASCTKATYTITMTEDRKDRKFYCIVTDKKGNEVKSKTVTMKMAASIKTEPKSVKTSIGKKAKFTVKAVGDDLKYQWYYKDVDGKKYKKASGTKATYTTELTKARNGRKFYCVVTDKYGNTVKTKTVSMKKK